MPSARPSGSSSGSSSTRNAASRVSKRVSRPSRAIAARAAKSTPKSRVQSICVSAPRERASCGLVVHTHRSARLHHERRRGGAHHEALEGGQVAQTRARERDGAQGPLDGRGRRAHGHADSGVVAVRSGR